MPGMEKAALQMSHRSDQAYKMHSASRHMQVPVQLDRPILCQLNAQQLQPKPCKIFNFIRDVHSVIVQHAIITPVQWQWQ